MFKRLKAKETPVYPVYIDFSRVPHDWTHSKDYELELLDDESADPISQEFAQDYKIIKAEYCNGGGGNMLGVFQVYFYNDNVVRFVLVDAEYVGIYTADPVFDMCDDVRVDCEKLTVALIPYWKREYIPTEHKSLCRDVVRWTDKQDPGSWKHYCTGFYKLVSARIK